MTFQRARKKEQIEDRKKEILMAAERLFNAGGLEDVTFSRIAKDVSFTRQTIYTYYHTREEVLLALLGEKLEEFYGSLHTMFPDGRLLTRKEFCKCVARHFIAHKETLRLFALRHTVLEENVRYENLVAFNRIMLKVFPTVKNILRQQCPGTDDTTFDTFTFTMISYFASIYPILAPHPNQLKAIFEAVGAEVAMTPEECLEASIGLMTAALKFKKEE
ncbi:TetR family transcriptional regulator [Selenomonas sp.]|uniref:TetR family transcriptional regulator n=1 Tax=Selenomonas sp. TaxID=2053611 RepID=UPI0025EE8A1A|nr:TetR family transcriptional regulator [Selenomonas sp.]MCI6284772.1 TetR/AcrR family transcriptional regulator [Selenomonas sp.]